jgi:hypothetical protein
MLANRGGHLFLARPSSHQPPWLALELLSRGALPRNHAGAIQQGHLPDPEPESIAAEHRPGNLSVPHIPVAGARPAMVGAIPHRVPPLGVGADVRRSESDRLVVVLEHDDPLVLVRRVACACEEEYGDQRQSYASMSRSHHAGSREALATVAASVRRAAQPRPFVLVLREHGAKWPDAPDDQLARGVLGTTCPYPSGWAT